MDAAEQPVLSVNLTMTPELNNELQREAGSLAVAQAYVIDSPEMAQAANTELQQVKGRITRVKEQKAGFVEDAKRIIARAEALFDPAINALVESEKFLKGGLLTYQQNEERKADEARRAQEAADRAARQKAEQEAAAARARAEEQAAAARKAAQDAEVKRQAALAEGNARAAAAAAAEKAKQEEKANAAIQNGEAKAMEVEQIAAAAPSLVVVPQPQKLDGFSMRDNWIAELAPGVADEADLVPRLVAAITGVEVKDFKRPDILALVAYESKAAGKLAKALKGSMSIPGLVARNKPVAASRAA